MTSYTNSLIGYATTTLANPPTSVRPATVVSNPGSWGNIGGAADLAAAVADESDLTYAQSPASPSSAAFTVAWTTRLDATQTIVSTRFRVTSSAPVVNILIELLEVVSGSPVVRSSRTTAAAIGWNTYEWTLTSTENSSIVDRTKLEGRITAGV